MFNFYKHLEQSTRIAVAGDWHLNQMYVKKVLNRIERHKVQVVLHVGDFGYYPAYEDYAPYIRHINARAELNNYVVIFIDGNHEQYDSTPLEQPCDSVIITREGLATLKAQADENGFVQIAPRIFWATRGASARIGTANGARGVSFLGLGGAGSIDREYQQLHGFWSPNEHVTDQDIAAAYDGAQNLNGVVDIMLTHDAPTGAFIPTTYGKPQMDGVPPEVMAEAFTTRDRIAKAVALVKPTCLFHGHWHRFNRSVQVDIDGYVVPQVIGLADETGTNNLRYTDTSLWDCSDSDLMKKLHSNTLWFW